MEPAPQAVVEAIWPATARDLGVRLVVPPRIAAAHTRPGQWVSLGGGDRPLILALASSPGAPRLELLLGPEAQARLPLAVGQTVEIGAPEGPGFPLERAEGLDVLIFAVGSGMSAARPLVDAIAAKRASFGRVILYAGARSWEHHAFTECDAGWASGRIEVRRSIGRPWVQDQFTLDGVSLDRAFAFAVGMKEMVEGVRGALIAKGLPAERFGLNF